MSLPSGARLGAYEILAPLGAGGMGEVYRARDTRLGREVAIKQLAPSLAQDPDYLSRFEREAQVLASLNHPNIAAIYAIEEGAIVMELVPGETLADQVARGPISLDAALPLLRQIAEALEAAHEKGIVHRDLKPANVKVSPEGIVKVLDFGLAKTPESAGQSAAAANSPTLTIRSTQAGVIMGTAAYMSPEQASGKPVDRRADIWAFGVVLYEMLTGSLLFQGETISHTLADVLRAPIDLSRLPVQVRDLAGRCLDRNLKTRLRDIGEARIAIDRILANPAPAAVAETPRSSRLPWIVAAAAIVLSAGAFALRPSAAPFSGHATAFLVPPPEKQHYHSGRLSPDGKWLVLEIDRGGGTLDTYLGLRAMDSSDLRPLAQTDSANNPFWSPDSRSIAFFQQGKLRRFDLEGGSVATIGDSPGGANRNGTWSRQGLILISSGDRIDKMPASGGVATQAYSTGDEARRRLQFLPDGEHYLYVAQINGTFTDVRIGNVANAQSTRLIEGSPIGAFAPESPGATRGHLLFVRNSTLVAQPFDAKTLALSGDPQAAAENATLGGSLLFAVTPATSETGTLSYGTGVNETVLASIGPAGSSSITNPGVSLHMALSPDGRRVILSAAAQNGQDLWLVDLATKNPSRFTFRPEERSDNPVWSLDGNRIIFAATRAGVAGIYEKPANGAGEPKLLLAVPEPVSPHGFSPDGKFLVYSRTDPKTRVDLWLLPLTGDRTPRPYLQTQFDESHGQVSPDGRFMVYESTENQVHEIYVRTFPDPEGGKWLISRGRGGQPRWSPDGKKIYFLNGGRILTEVPVRTSPTFEAGSPKDLYAVTVPGSYNGAQGTHFAWALAGDHVIALTASESNAPVMVIENWRAKLSRK